MCLACWKVAGGVSDIAEYASRSTRETSRQNSIIVIFSGRLAQQCVPAVCNAWTVRRTVTTGDWRAVFAGQARGT